MDSIHKKQSLNIVFITGVLVLFACLIISINHIIDIRKSLENEIQKQIETQINVAQKHIAVELNDSVRLSSVLADEIAPFSETEDDKDRESIVEVLKRYKNIGDYEKVEYVDLHGFMIDDQGKDQMINHELLKEISSISEKGIYISNDEEYFRGDYHMLSISPVHKDKKRTGSIIGIKDCGRVLENHSFDYLLTTGDVMIVDEKGAILDCSFVNVVDQTEHYDTVFDCMHGYWNLDDISIQKVENLIADSGKETKVIEVHNKEGNRYFYSCINTGEYSNMSLLVMYTDEIFKDVHNNILYGSIITIVLLIGMMAIFSLISYRYSASAGKTIKKLAYEDEITGGHNLNYFKEFTIDTLTKYPNVHFHVCRFDVANFRYINEAYGHIKADQLLKIISEEADQIFKGRECCVRMTADQFVLLARESDDIERRFVIFTDKVNARALDVGIRYPIKFKRGFYKVDKKESNISLMIDKANVARKTLTGEEIDSIAYYDESLVADMKKVDKIESEMETAMFNGEFKMFIQPKWDIKENHIYGGEALVRWIKDDGAMVYPSDFVPVFEKNGFVERLDMFMLESACVLINGLMAEGKPCYPISVNQSRVLMHSPDYTERVTELLNRYQIPEGYIELEVTETVLFAESEKMITLLKNLKKRHIALSMDDFGSGYSSLNMLKDFPFDVLKIDKEFFSETLASRTSIWILKKIIEMADGLGLRVICEGVETEDQIEMLKKIGCRYVQGYYYSKPIPADEFVSKYCDSSAGKAEVTAQDKADE